MKKLGRLNLNSEKLMKNEELLALRGGYDENPCGEGIEAFNCTVWACTGCLPTYGVACGIDNITEYVQSHGGEEGWYMECHPY